MPRPDMKFSPRPIRLLLGGLIILNIIAIGFDAFVFPRDNMVMGGAAGVERPRPPRDSRENILTRLRQGIQPAVTGPLAPERRQPPAVQEPQRRPERRTPIFRPFGPYQGSWVGVSLYVASFFSLLGASIAMIFLWPHRLRRLKEAIKVGWRGKLRLGFIGFLGYAVALLFTMLSGLVIVGLPLALLIILGLVLATLTGLVAVSLTVGNQLAKLGQSRASSPLFQLILGILLLFPVSVIPIIGWLAVGALACLGLGSILLTKFGSEGGWSLEALQE